MEVSYTRLKMLKISFRFGIHTVQGRTVMLQLYITAVPIGDITAY